MTASDAFQCLSRRHHMRMIVRQPGGQDGRGAGRQFGRLSPPALICDHRRQVQQGQADFGILRPEDGLQDPQRPAAQ